MGEWTERETATKAKKHVLLMYADGGSSSCLFGEGLPNSAKFGAIYNGQNFEEAMESTFLTADGIQYHPTKGKVTYDTPWEEGAKREGDIRKEVEEIAAKLSAEGKSLDAVIMPCSDVLDDKATNLNFLRDMQERFPGIKTVVHNVSLMHNTLPNPEKNRAAWPNDEASECYYAMEHAVLRNTEDGPVMERLDDGGNETDSYGMHEAVDYATHQLPRDSQVNILREALDMPPVQQKGAQR